MKQLTNLARTQQLALISPSPIAELQLLPPILLVMLFLFFSDSAVSYLQNQIVERKKLNSRAARGEKTLTSSNYMVSRQKLNLLLTPIVLDHMANEDVDPSLKTQNFTRQTQTLQQPSNIHFETMDHRPSRRIVENTQESQIIWNSTINTHSPKPNNSDSESQKHIPLRARSNALFHLALTELLVHEIRNYQVEMVMICYDLQILSTDYC